MFSNAWHVGPAVAPAICHPWLSEMFFEKSHKSNIGWVRRAEQESKYLQKTQWSVSGSVVSVISLWSQLANAEYDFANGIINTNHLWRMY